MTGFGFNIGYRGRSGKGEPGESGGSDGSGTGGNGTDAGDTDGGDGGSDPDGGVIEVLIVTGQSNERGSNLSRLYRTPLDPRVMQWPANDLENELEPAVERLRFPRTAASEDGIGPAMPTAEALLAELGADDRIVLAPLAVGGTGYSAGTSRWAVGEERYANAVARLGALRAHLAAVYPSHELRWTFIGFAGEADASAGIAPHDYIELVKTSFEGMASAAGIGEFAVCAALMSPAWVTTGVRANAIEGAKLGLRERMPRTAIVASPDGPYDPSTSVVHFDGAAQVERGRRIAAALPLARSRTEPLASGVDALDAIGLPAWGAFSLYRRLSAAHSGAAFRIARASDGAEADIGFTAEGYVDLAAAEAHCGASDGLVTAWYDQTGQGRNIAAAPAARSPRLVLKGRVVWRNGRPMMGGNSGALLANESPPAGVSVMVAASTLSSGTRYLVSSTNLNVYHRNGGPYAIVRRSGGTQNVGVALADGVHVLIGQADAPPRVDGGTPSVVPIGSASSTYSGALSVFARFPTQGDGPKNVATGLMSELIVGSGAWSEDQKLALEALTVPQHFPDPTP